MMKMLLLVVGMSTLMVCSALNLRNTLMDSLQSAPISAMDVEAFEELVKAYNPPDVQYDGNPLFQICRGTKWVYCANAQCEPPKPSQPFVTQCACWIQEEGDSISPVSTSGAPAWYTYFYQPGKYKGVVGDKICAEQAKGKLYSTLGNGVVPPLSYAGCKPRTKFGYCWGAICKPDPHNKTMALCDCPVAESALLNQPQYLAIQTANCPGESAAIADPCDTNAVMFNGALDYTSDIIGQILGGSVDTCFSE